MCVGGDGCVGVAVLCVCVCVLVKAVYTLSHSLSLKCVATSGKKNLQVGLKRRARWEGPTNPATNSNPHRTIGCTNTTTDIPKICDPCNGVNGGVWVPLGNP